MIEYDSLILSADEGNVPHVRSHCKHHISWSSFYDD